EVIQEGEERPARGPRRRLPVEERAVRPRRVPRLVAEPLLTIRVSREQDALDEPATDRARGGERGRREVVVFPAVEAAIQARLVAAIVRIRREASRAVAARRERLGQRRIAPVEDTRELRVELVRPVAGEQAAVGG